MMILDVKTWTAGATEILFSLVAASTKMFILAVLVFLLLKFFRIKTPGILHRVWSVVLGGMLILPLTSYLISPPVSVAVLPESLKTALSGSELFPDGRESKADEPVNNLSSNQNQTNSEPAEKPFPANDGSEPITGKQSMSPVFPNVFDILPVLFLAIYFSGLIIMLSRFMRGVFKTRRLLKSCQIIDDEKIAELCRELVKPSFFKRRLNVLCSPQIMTPVTTGLFRPRILLPENWKDWEELKLKSILAHELAHIRREDYLFLLLAKLNKCLNWFNPLSWFIAKQLADLAEMASDRLAIDHVKDSGRYARYLLELAALKTEANFNRLNIDGVRMIRQSQVATRINLILQPANGSLNERRYLKLLLNTLCFSLLLTVAITGVKLWSATSGSIFAVDNFNISGNETQKTADSPSVENLSLNAPKPGADSSTEEKPEVKPTQNPALNVVDADKSPYGLDSETNAPEVSNKNGETQPSIAVKTDLSSPETRSPISGNNEEKPQELATKELVENKADNSVKSLISALNDTNPTVREKAAAELKLRRDNRAVDALIRSLNDNNSKVRRQAAETLGAIGDKRAVDPLINTLKDGNSNVRQTASKVLGDIGSDRAADSLEKMSADNNQSVRDTAKYSLSRLRNNKKKDQ